MLSVSETEPGCLPSISAALAAAGRIAMIVVRPGTYREQVRLTGDVTVVAEDGPGTVTLDGGDGVAVLVDGGEVALHGLTVRGGSPTRPAVQVVGGTLRATGCAITGRGAVAVHVPGGQVDLRDCQVGNPSGGGFLFARGGAGTVSATTVRGASSGVVIVDGADPVLRGCVLVDIRGVGVLSTRGGRGTLEDCEISATDGPAVEVEGNGALRVVRGRLHDLPGMAVVVGGGRPVLEDCEIRAVGGHAIVVSGTADPLFRRCTVRGAAGYGLLLSGQATGAFTDGEIADTGAAAVAVTGSAAPLIDGGEVAGGPGGTLLYQGEATGALRRLTVRGGPAGIVVGGSAAPLVEDCVVEEAGEYGVQLLDQARPVVHGTRVQRCVTGGFLVGAGATLSVDQSTVQDCGVGFQVDGAATVTGSDVGAARSAGILVQPGAHLTLLRSRVHHSGGPGVWFTAGSSGRVNACELVENAGEGLLREGAEPVRVDATTMIGNGGKPVGAHRCPAPGDVPEAPGAWPLLGHIVPMLRQPLGFLPGLARHGDVVRVRFGRLPVYVVTHPDAVRDVLVPGDVDFERGLCFDLLEPGLGRGIATASGIEHRRLRRLLQPVFSRERLATYSSIMRTVAEETTAGWHDGQELAADEVMDDLALTALTRSLFRFTPDTGTGEAIKHGMRMLTHGLLKRIVLPAAWERVPTLGNIRFRRAMTRMNRAVDQVVTAYREAGEDRGDVLSALLLARDEDGVGLSDQEVHAQVMTLALTGVEAPGATLAWLLYEIGRSAEVTDRVCAELDEVLGGRAPEHDDLPALEYTGRVVDEVLRLHTPLLFSRRTLTTAKVGRSAIIPPGAELVYSPYLLHHDDRWFPDAARFDPDRWLPANARHIPKGAYIPFAAGSHQCIGKPFAISELTMITAVIFSRWTLRPTPGAAVREVASALVRPSELPMTVHLRRGDERPAPAGPR
ncbi:cytochrome P450 [Micromonospora haikouensis]|uniref:cytochrome P450 n=1 Tax=Micromonospora haikouensis TaxID=686309 RepID=UPI0037912909